MAYEYAVSCEPSPLHLERIGDVRKGIRTQTSTGRTSTAPPKRAAGIREARSRLVALGTEGIDAAKAAGAVPTSTEAALFQLLRVAGTEEFKKLSKLVR